MDLPKEKQLMLHYHLKGRDITSEPVLDAMEHVPREAFVPDEYLSMSYEDRPLPIDNNQTISQPYIVALMTQSLKITKGDNILEIGTGSGYQTAILAQIVGDKGKITTIERIKPLSLKAQSVLKNLNYNNIEFLVNDGTQGYEKNSPYNGIIVTAAAPKIPEKLISQLARDGKMVIPVGDRFSQDLLLITKEKDGTSKKTICGCRFVPLIGDDAW